MKATILGLVVSTGAFGASTVFFWHQLSKARDQSEMVAEANRRLNQRVEELEKARDQLMSQRLGPGATNPFMAGAIDQNSPRVTNVSALAAAAAAGKEGDKKNEPPPFTVFNRSQMPPSMVKTMRKQMRMQNEKTYFDLEARLGLSKEDSDKLLDLITEQQTAGIGRMHDPNNPAQGDAMRNEWQRIDGEITDLLGPTKAAGYSDYKKEMPARMEVAMLAQQFESSESPLNDQQRTRLITAMSEERDSVPMPSFSSSASPDQYRKDYESWQSDYEQRVGERARTILNSSQLTVYDEYQQFQKDMRAQMAAHGRIMTPGNVSIGGPAVRMGTVRPPDLPAKRDEN